MRKVSLPDPVQGFVYRQRLAELCDPLRRRLTLLHAPAGFGKTTLLADCCRRLRERGLVTAWLSVDEDDDAALFSSYLLVTFRQAGLELLDDTPFETDDHDRGINLLIHSLEQHGADCVLTIDEADRLDHRRSIRLLDRLLRYGPPNLHVAMAFREHPVTLDVSTTLFEGRGAVISAEDLRFDRSEIARFFGTKLSRRELAAVTESTNGWPIALRAHRNLEGVQEDVQVGALATNWIETHLWRGMSEDDRVLVLDAGLFGWADPELFDEVLSKGAVRRLHGISALRGLLESLKASTALRLHPMIGSYCADKLRNNDPERFCSTHASIAKALARRGDVVAAVRHASEADDALLTGRILEDAGGLRLWLREGTYTMLMVSRYLNEAIGSAYPRLALLRCLALILAGDFNAARRIYAQVDAATEHRAPHDEGSSDLQLRIDRVLFEGMMALSGCEPLDSPHVRKLIDQLRELVGTSGLDADVRAGLCHTLGYVEYARSNLEAAAHFVSNAQSAAAESSPFLSMFSNFQAGAIAMAQGRSEDAHEAYNRGQMAARQSFYRDGTSSLIGDVLMVELDLERNRKTPPAQRLHRPELLAASGAWMDLYIATADTASSIVLGNGDLTGALRVLEQTQEFARHTNRRALLPPLAALQVVVLLDAGRLDEARAVWSAQHLPIETDECLVFETRGWRTAEAIGYARARLLAAESQFGAAAELAGAMAAEASSRVLLRTLTWSLAAAMAAEQGAGNPAKARAHLNEYLRVYARTGYTRALMNNRDAVLEVMDSGEVPMEPSLSHAWSSLRQMLEASSESREDAVPAMTERELEVLQLLEHYRDKEIASSLALTEDGVRYHVKKIFRKLKANNRVAAVQRARDVGILSSQVNPPPPRLLRRVPPRVNEG